MPIVELNNMENDVPVLIIGAGISGLLLAQQLRQLEIPFQIFERDSSFTARGSGWGLTLHWSLPALHQLLPEHLLSRLRETYVDLGAVERGEGSTFPFFDLTTGERKGGVPQAGENQRIRVSRERLRNLLATDIEIQVKFRPLLQLNFSNRRYVVGQVFQGALRL
jgi:2-polyprenyl-6-methoxyphenol hydroxylase-like FAD-dependent oxidoreductase